MREIKIFLYFLVFISAQNGKSQNLPGVDMSQADILREEGKIKEALQEFKKIYLQEPENRLNVYNYACALSIDKQIDSSFKYLRKAIELKPTENALTDPDFVSLRESQSWNSFENGLIEQLGLESQIKNLPYAKDLWKLKAFDQAYYEEINLAERKIGKESSVVSALWKLKEIYNLQNQKAIENLVSKYGWPKISEVGNRAASAAFLVIQHSNLQKQKTFLPEIKKLCEIGEADWQEYALMFDRIRIDENEKQRFGSQIKYNSEKQKFELFPLENPTKVDEWRKEISLQPLNEYLANWNIKFDVNENKNAANRR